MDHAVFRERRLELTHLLKRGAATDALVFEHYIAVSIFNADNLVVECTGILCLAGLFVRVEGELVEHRPGQAPLGGHHLRADPLVGGAVIAALEVGRVGVTAAGQ